MSEEKKSYPNGMSMRDRWAFDAAEGFGFEIVERVQDVKDDSEESSESQDSD